MTNAMTNAPRGSRTGDRAAAGLEGDSPVGFTLDEETVALDGVVIDIEQLGAFEVVKRAPVREAGMG